MRRSTNSISTRFISYSRVPLNFGTPVNTSSLSIEGLLTVAQQAAFATFSHYKLAAVKFEFIPLSNAIGSTARAVNEDVVHAIAPSIYTLFQNNRDEVYSTLDAIQRNPRHKCHSPFARITRYAKLRPQIDITMGVSDVTLISKNMFISTNDLGATFGNFLIQPDEALVASVESSQTYTLRRTVYVILKNLNIND